jgi:uncharacterized 2Fe-2S/4Fe-4S cluster protein (DUF4445 family)
MPMQKFKVTFYPDNKTVEIPKDSSILEAANSCGIYINSSCGGDGVCGKCKIILKEGQVFTQISPALSIDEKNRNIYLACITSIQSDLIVEIPPESRLDLNSALKDIFSKSEEIESKEQAAEEERFKTDPITTKLYLELPQPTLADTASDLERIMQWIRKKEDLPIMQTGLSNIRQLGELLRESEWKVTVTLGKRNDTVEIVLIEPGDTSENNFGIAFDIGTTTITGQLVNLNNRKILGTKAAYNRQASFGSDVITRIVHARSPEGLEQLHTAVTETMNQMIQELTEEHNVALNDLNSIVCTGNTTMIHLLLRVDPKYIRREPYVPTANFLPVIRAAEAGIRINTRGLLSCIPGVSSYVGGDTTSGILSSEIYKSDDLNLLIDIGTNGEIAFGNKDFLVACAASAGPAFEGSGVSSGMRAANGAIQKVDINPKDLLVTASTIGESKPRGICGSGYISLIAQMLKAGIIDRSGKIKIDNHPRVRQTDAGKEFIVVFKDEGATSADIIISEADIENLKRAKAAIFSATSILIKHMNFDLTDINKIFIAGGFGTSLDVESAIKIGLLPDIDRNKLTFIGNSALKGAREALLSSEAAKISEEIAKRTTYFELSVDPGYMDEYVSALFFPHTDLNRFPSENK